MSLLFIALNTLTLPHSWFGGPARLLLHEKPQHEQPQSCALLLRFR